MDDLCSVGCVFFLLLSGFFWYLGLGVSTIIVFVMIIGILVFVVLYLLGLRFLCFALWWVVFYLWFGFGFVY